MSDQESVDEPELNAAAIVAVLNRHQVRYVIIDAFAAIAQQAPIPATSYIDVTPETSQENLARLSLALTELGARILKSLPRTRRTSDPTMASHRLHARRDSTRLHQRADVARIAGQHHVGRGD